MVKVSAIIPVYNVAKYLRQCLDSLVGQTLRDIEIICVDDGSTDGSGAILDEYAAKDSRVRAIHQANAGAGAARNVGLNLARGDYLFFADPDDWMREDLLMSLHRCAASADADVVVAGYVKHANATGRESVQMPRREWPVKEVFSSCDIPTKIFNLSRHTVWDKLFKRAFVAGRKICFQQTPRFNDMFFCDCSLALAKRITVCRYAGYVHRIGRPGGLQATKSMTPFVLVDAYDALARRLRDENLDRLLARSYVRAFASSGRDVARQLPTEDAKRLCAMIVRRLIPYWRRVGVLSWLVSVRGLIRARLELNCPFLRGGQHA